MKVWKPNKNDTKRVRLLKKCAHKLHLELMEFGTRPVDIKSPLQERLIIADITKLNRRIKMAEDIEAKGSTGKIGL